MTQFSVQVDGKVVSGGIVSVNGNVVTIDPAAFSGGSKIKFSYSHDAIPMFTEIPLKAAPSLDTLKILVNFCEILGKSAGNSARFLCFGPSNVVESS
jgi:hypothetical protein